MNKTYIKKFGKNLKKLRKSKGLSQDDLASEKISRSMISLIELGLTDVTITKLKVIAENLNLEIKDLFDFK